ncbi:hypothetical protein ACLKM7_10720 [Microbacterium sp. I2]|uniref:hypothetical protein n=1 Tax=Microbacterium sp. I2 TaxID=3391826 RepID=UPI003EDA0B49
MSTPEQPATPPLTRKQMREIRNTGSNPVIPPGSTADPTPAAETPAPTPEPPTPEPPTPAAAAPVDAVPASAIPLARPATPAAVPPPPVADSAVDLGVSPLTRRQARQQERIRTASVPVITPEVVAAHAGGPAASVPTFAFPAAADRPVEDARSALFAEPEVAEQDHAAAEEVPAERDSAEAVTSDSGRHPLFGFSGSQPEPQREPVAPAFPWAQQEAADAPAPSESQADVFADEAGAAEASPFGDLPFAPAEDAASSSDEEEADDERARAVVNPLFGAGLLGAPSAAEPIADLPPSFDQLLSRTTGSISVPNALIVSQAPEVSPLVAPVTATGEVLVTGTFNLPEGLGSTGHANGTADGKEIDATLVDGELPSHSSPTPIAASSAVSTVKTPGEVIKPPVPEKGNRLMMSLAITAGVLALALVGVLILAFVTGVF